MSSKKKQGTQTRVVYLNLPFDIAVKLAADAEDQMRPMSVHAAWIIKKFYADKGGGKAVEKEKKGS